MKMVLLTLFFLFLIINSSKSVYIQDISPPSTSYKSYSDSNGKCAFDYFYMLINTTETTTLSGGFVFSRYQNGSAQVILIDVGLVDIGFRSISVDNTLNFDIECIEFKYDWISFKRVDSNINPTLGASSISYSIVYELVSTVSLLPGALKNLPFNSAQCTDLVCNLNYENQLLFSLNIQVGQNIELFIDKPFFMTIDGYTFELEPFIKSEFDQVYDVISNPISYYLSNLSTYGFGETALVSFISNSSIFKRPYIIKFNSNTVFQYYPIFGDENSTTYLFAIPIYDQSFTCDLYFQNGTSFVAASPQITGYIQSYKINSLSSIYSYIYGTDQLPVIDISFTLSSQYYNNYVEVGVHQSVSKFKFPYGFIKKLTGNQLQYQVTTLVKSFSYGSNEFYLKSPIDSISPFTYSNRNGSYQVENLPKVTNVEKFYLFGDKWLLKIYTSLVYSFGSITIYPSKRIGIESKVGSADVFEVIISSSKDTSFELFDMFDGKVAFSDYTLLSGSGLGGFYSAPGLLKGQFDVYSIQNVSFLYNNLNVTNRRHYNIMYFNYTDISRDTSIVMNIIDSSINQNLIENINIKLDYEPFYAIYDYGLQLFKIEFYVDPNIQYGELQYSLTIGGIHHISHSAIKEKLIIKTTTMDLDGPRVKEFTARSSEGVLSVTNPVGTVSWSFRIEDAINGFDWGYFVVRGTLDQSVYNFTFTADDVVLGDRFYGDYSFEFNVTYPCYTQDFEISELVLYDRVKRVSIYSTYVENPSISGVLNPFAPLLYTSGFYSRNALCTTNPNNTISRDSTPPVLVSFKASTNQVDSSIPQTIEITFEAQDFESGIKTDQNPIVYLSTTYNQVLECKSEIISSLSGSIDYSVQYKCSIEIPIGFGDGDGIILSVYGFINRNRYYSGYSTRSLKNNQFDYIIASSYQNSNNTIFSNHYRISEKGGDLWVQGKNLNQLASQITIEYDDGSKQLITPENVHYTVLRLPNIKATTKTFKVYSSNSNTLIVTPTIYDFYLNPIDSSSSSSDLSSSSSSSSNEIPTNAPQKCYGNPICGGPSNGICTSNGCVCYSPWIGLDCSSQIIIIDQPTVNDTSPSTSITLPTTDNNNSTVTYKSLITLVSIREIDVFGNVVYNKSFEKWQVAQSESDSTLIVYNTTLEIIKNNQTSATSVKATLKWFTQETNITFANEQLVMNPSSMKYTIEIDNYPFNNNLNILQLVMSASILSNSTDDICSNREFGETSSGDNSNYLQIQVDNHSLYGRFIRRGIIDSSIRSVSNVLLDKDMKSITTTKQLQSFIGIEIPNFKRNAIIDPDFSILLNSNSASSICSNNSKLSGAKIAGIVIGCVAFVAVISVAVSYHVIKKKKQAKFISNMNQKMKNMD